MTNITCATLRRHRNNSYLILHQKLQGQILALLEPDVISMLRNLPTSRGEKKNSQGAPVTTSARQRAVTLSKKKG